MHTADEVGPHRRRFLTAAMTGAGGIGTTSALTLPLASWAPRQEAWAAAALADDDINKLESGGGGPAGRGGLFSPRQGVRYGFAGRAYKDAPASLNVKIPPYKYLGDTPVPAGDDLETA